MENLEKILGEFTECLSDKGIVDSGNFRSVSFQKQFRYLFRRRNIDSRVVLQIVDFFFLGFKLLFFIFFVQIEDVMSIVNDLLCGKG